MLQMDIDSRGAESTLTQSTYIDESDHQVASGGAAATVTAAVHGQAHESVAESEFEAPE